MSDQNQYWNPNQGQGAQPSGQYPAAGQPSANDPYQATGQPVESDPYATVARSHLTDPQASASDPYAAQQPVDPNQYGYGQGQYQQGYDPNQYPQQGGYDPYAQQYPAGYAAQQSQPVFDTAAVAKQGSSFFKDLFDLSFNKFVTPRVVSVIYLLAMIAVGLGTLFWVITPFLGRQPVIGVIMLLVAPVIALLWISLVRVSLESMVALIRVAENTREMKDKTPGAGEYQPPAAS